MKRLIYVLLLFLLLLSCTKVDNNDKKEECNHEFSYTLIDNESTIETSCEKCEYSYKIAPNFNFSYNFGYLDLSNYMVAKNAQKLYLNIYVKLLEFSRAKIDLNESKINNEKNYEIATINYKNLALSKNQAMAIWHSVILDNPEFYFAEKTVLTSENNIVLLCNSLYTKHEQREVVDNKINGLKHVVKSTQKLDIINEAYEYVIDNLTYAYETINGEKVPKTDFDSYELSGALLYKEGVCEAYSKLFSYLLKLNGIKAIIYVGNGVLLSREYVRHRWTLVEVNNLYYGFDLTWDDSNSNRSNYGLSYDNLNIRHKPIELNSSSLEIGIDYVYKMPTMATENLIQN